jgi:RND family efflux transporter MFP subunit
MSKRFGITAFFSLLMALFIAGFFVVYAKDKGKQIDRNQFEKPVPVKTITIETRDLPVVVESVGRLYPDRSVTLSAQIPGEVKYYKADVGDIVKKGQLLVQIKPVDYELALEEAESNLLAAEAQLSAAGKAYERFKSLLPRKVISRDNFDKVESEYKTARAQAAQAKVGVKIARERLEKTRIKASFSSLVAARHIEVGQMIGTNDPVMTLLDLSRVRVKVFLAEKDFVFLDRHDPVRIMVEAYPERQFNGRIDRIDVSADPATNTFGVEILIDNEDLVLKAGLSARVYLTTKVLSNVILIPQSAVLFREDRAEVFVVEADQKAQPRVVQLGQTQSDIIQVLAGLKNGDRLIVRGHNYVKPGTKVTYNNEQQQKN